MQGNALNGQDKLLQGAVQTDGEREGPAGRGEKEGRVREAVRERQSEREVERRKGEKGRES